MAGVSQRLRTAAAYDGIQAGLERLRTEASKGDTEANRAALDLAERLASESRRQEACSWGIGRPP